MELTAKSISKIKSEISKRGFDGVSHLVSSIEIDKSLDKLTERNRKIVELRYLKEETLQSISEQFGITKSRVKDICEDFLRSVRYFVSVKENQILREITLKSCGDIMESTSVYDIQELFTLKAFHCLRRAGVYTLQELFDLVDSEKIETKMFNCGVCVGTEIKSVTEWLRKNMLDNKAE